MANQVEMVFWDVQHGHATYIKTPNKKHILIDLGIGDYSGKDEKFSPIKHLYNNWRIRKVDALIITHPHLDHIDDILNIDLVNPSVFVRPKQLTNDEVMKGVRQNDKAKFDKYCSMNDRYNLPIKDDSEDNIHNSDNLGGMDIQFFTPTSCNHNNFNNHSIITVIEYSNIKIVVPGDNEKCSFDELMQSNHFRNAVKDADILLAPHHGRESGYNADFVTLVNPRLTVVSDGRFCDTSANPRYTAKSRGWTVHKKNGTSSQRKCLTTNSDGEVFINFGKSEDPKYDSFLQVQIP